MESKVFCLRLRGRSPKRAVIWSIISQILINFPTGRDLSPSFCGLICTPEIMNENSTGVRGARLLGWCKALNTPSEGSSSVEAGSLALVQGPFPKSTPPGSPGYKSSQASRLWDPLEGLLPLTPCQEKRSPPFSAFRWGACVCSCTFAWACKKGAPFGISVCEVLDRVMSEDFRTGPLTWRPVITQAVVENLWPPGD